MNGEPISLFEEATERTPSKDGEAGWMLCSVCAELDEEPLLANTTLLCGNCADRLVSYVDAGTATINADFYDSDMEWNYNCICQDLGPKYYGTVSAQVTVNCGDTRDGLRTEYFPQNYGADFIPGCGEFTFGNSGDQITTHFTFGELNVRDIASNEYPNWAILRNYFLTAIENTRSNYNAALNVSPPGSAYRSPFISAILNPPGATNSRHIHGDAVDFASDSNTWDAIANAATNAQATCVESRQATFPGHVHASWGPSGTC